MTFSNDGRISGKNYAFPNVSFDFRTIGPVPFETEWRNTIGVAGVFNRGPALATISSRDEFIKLYGEDNTSGSLFIKQAMMQGATNFIVSRVMPEVTPSVGTIAFQTSSNPTINVAETGETENRTVGMIAEFENINKAILQPGTFIGTLKKSATEVVDIIPETNETDLLNSSFNFVGYGEFQVKAVGTFYTANLADSASVECTPSKASTTASGIVELTFTPPVENPNAMLVMCVPGFKAQSGQEVLEVISYAYKKTNTIWGVLVKGVVTAGVKPFTFKKPVGTAWHTVFAYNFVGLKGASLPGEVIANKNYYVAGSALGFFAVRDNNLASDDPATTVYKISDWININPITYVANGNNFSTLTTGVKLRFSSSSTDISAAFSNKTSSTYFSVGFLKKKITVGAVQNTGTGWQNSSLAFPPKTSSLFILESLKNAILAEPAFDTIFEEVRVNNSSIPYSLVFETKQQRARLKNVKYSVKPVLANDAAGQEGNGTPEDLLYGPSNALYRRPQITVGERQTFSPASIMLYTSEGEALVYLEAISPGVLGNQIVINVRPQTRGIFQLDVFYNRSNYLETAIAPETYTIDLHNVDLATGTITELLSSYMIRGYFVPLKNSNGAAVDDSVYDKVPTRLAPPSNAYTAEENVALYKSHPSHLGINYLKNINLAGGQEPFDYINNIPEADYTSAIRRLESQDCAIIGAAGIYIGDIRYTSALSELVAQATSATPSNGLRIAVLAAPPNLSASRAASIGSVFSGKEVVIVSGWNTTVGTESQGLNRVSPDGLYAGFLASTSPQISPASAAQGRGVNGILTVDTRANNDLLDALTRARIEVLAFDSASGSYKFLNGLCTTNNRAERWVSLTRTAHHLIMNLYTNLQWARSSVNDDDLRAKVSTASDAFLTEMVRKGIITGHTPTICSRANNTPLDISMGKLNISLQYTPVFPADYIRISMVQQLVSNFSVQLGS